MGEVLEIESDGVAWDRASRVRILIDVTQPLRRIQKISMKNGEMVLIENKYELRLPTFCYSCGIMGHIEWDCLMHLGDEREVEK